MLSGESFNLLEPKDQFNLFLQSAYYYSNEKFKPNRLSENCGRNGIVVNSTINLAFLAQ